MGGRIEISFAVAIPEGVLPKTARSIIMDFSDICFL